MDDIKFGEKDSMAEIKMVVGLGNPGEEYVDTRHNAGFRVIDSLASALGMEVRKKKFSARFGEGMFADKKLILLKPWQFMNLSGQAVATAVGFYKLELTDLLVISDDMALEAGRIRIRTSGSSGGQKGLADIIKKLGTGEFARCRIGIGQNSRVDAYDHVLSPPTADERPLVDDAIERARQAVLCWIEFGIEAAMNKFNSRAERDEQDN